MIRWSSAGAVGCAAFYAGCVAYRVATHVAFCLAMVGTISLHVVADKAEVLGGPARASERAFASSTAMFSVGALSFVASTLIALRLSTRWPARRLACLGVIAVITTIFTGAADAHYGITPWSEIEWRQRQYNAAGAKIEHRLSVEDITHLDDSLSGVLAEAEGVLDYDARCRRYILRSRAEPGRYVKVFFFKGRRSSFSEMGADGLPRYVEAMRPWIGREVRLLGTCVNGQIDVELANVRTPD